MAPLHVATLTTQVQTRITPLTLSGRSPGSPAQTHASHESGEVPPPLSWICSVERFEERVV